MSPDFLPLRDAIVPTRERENGLVKEKPSTKAVFPFSRGKNRISQGVENRGSLISLPLALRVFAYKKWAVCKQFSPLRCRIFISLKKGKFVCQTSLSERTETPFKPDRVSFCTPNSFLLENNSLLLPFLLFLLLLLVLLFCCFLFLCVVVWWIWLLGLVWVQLFFHKKRLFIVYLVVCMMK